ATPRLRAAYELWIRCSSRRRTGYSATTAAVASVERLSTTISSSASRGQSCASSASRHVRIVASALCAGTITVTVGSSGTERLRCRRAHAACQRLGAATIARERVGQLVAALVLDGEHAGIAGRAKRGRERIEAVARSGERRLHVMALAQLPEQPGGGGRPAHHLQVDVQRAPAEEACRRRQVAAEEGEVARVDDGSDGGRAAIERGQDVARAGDLGVPGILHGEADALAAGARAGA